MHSIHRPQCWSYNSRGRSISARTCIRFQTRMDLGAAVAALSEYGSWERVLITVLVLVILTLLSERREKAYYSQVGTRPRVDRSHMPQKRRAAKEGQYYLEGNLIQPEWDLDRPYTCWRCARSGKQDYIFPFGEIWNCQEGRYITRCCQEPIDTRVPPPPSTR